MLEEFDREQAKEEERKAKREKKRINQARLRMKVGKNQLGIMDMIKVAGRKRDTNNI